MLSRVGTPVITWVFILLCSGLRRGVGAPGHCANEVSGAVPESLALSKDTPSVPLRAPEEAASEMLQDRFRVLVDGQVESLEELRHRVGHRSLVVGKGGRPLRVPAHVGEGPESKDH